VVGRLVGARLWLVLAAMLAVLALLVGGISGAATAAPRDDEGGTEQLQAALNKAAGGYNNAHAKFLTSQRQRAKIAQQIVRSERQIAVLTAEVQQLGAAAYRGGLPNTSAAMVNSKSLADLMGNVGLLDTLSRRRQRTLDDLRTAQASLAGAKKKLDKQLAKQRAAEQTMAERRADAEHALAAANVGGQPTKGFTADGTDADQPAAAGGGQPDGASIAATDKSVTSGRKTRTSGNMPVRKPTAARRRADGTWPSEGCSIPDPTSSGCLTPRTLHALQQTKATGFTHYVHCFRQASFGEHPKGRACDFAAAPSGFGGIATGSDRTYGNRLAAWFVNNADRLGVLYVIWFRQIWLPGIGWRAYHSSDDPAASHRNHVHLSVQ
jgi:hypothetical protein